ncbi:hypothetical protein SLEP1_g39950 [Rubroshorea leprosula]|uniref:Uncharacterized protein n=1 Tax=Rubroshorea leprosula TaxID=152421 RepID=A0AAV5L2P3_9ROSI|nr:hypothetical protein SLEP1_g39950 [Rubroshorea leprosula]
MPMERPRILPKRVGTIFSVIFLFPNQNDVVSLNSAPTVFRPFVKSPPFPSPTPGPIPSPPAPAEISAISLPATPSSWPLLAPYPTSSPRSLSPSSPSSLRSGSSSTCSKKTVWCCGAIA